MLNTFDSDSDSSQVEFKLPSDLEDKNLTVSASGPNRLLLQVDRGFWEQGSIVDLLTINPDGKIEHQDTVRLLGYVPEDSRLNSLFPAGIVPSLLPWCLGMFVVAPLVLLQAHQAPSFLQGIGKSWDEAWLGFLVVLAVSVILAFLVNHLQRKTALAHTGLWTTFVFLLGIPGLVAYWLHFRAAPFGGCSACGQAVPRDRETCAAAPSRLPSRAQGDRDLCLRGDWHGGCIWMAAY